MLRDPGTSRIGGENLFEHPPFPDAVPPEVASGADKGLADEAAFDATFRQWTEQRRR